MRTTGLDTWNLIGAIEAKFVEILVFNVGALKPAETKRPLTTLLNGAAEVYETFLPIDTRFSSLGWTAPEKPKPCVGVKLCAFLPIVWIDPVALSALGTLVAVLIALIAPTALIPATFCAFNWAALVQPEILEAANFP
ncbi:MAG: hypothetical protein WC547_03305, partial [Candidatus Omnitrophota bacterium]